MMPFLLIPGNGAEYIKRTGARLRRYPRLPALRAAAQVSVPDRSRHWPLEGKWSSRRTCCGATVRTDPAGRYPNKLVPLDEIGTDPTLATAFAPEGAEALPPELVRRGTRSQRRAVSWPGRRRLPGTSPGRHLGDGALLPQRLGADGLPRAQVDRTARDLHEELPGRERRLRPGQLGPEGRPCSMSLPTPGSPAIERRKIYDTTQPGRGNGGHTFGDKLERSRAHGGHRVSEDALTVSECSGQYVCCSVSSWPGSGAAGGATGSTFRTSICSRSRARADVSGMAPRSPSMRSR